MRNSAGGAIGFLGFLLCLGAIPAGAVPNSFFGNGFFGPVIPATPVFRADLTADFFEIENWNGHSFPGPWEEHLGVDDSVVRRMSANPTLLGAVPMAVYAYGGRDGETRELAIHYLDAGLFFGYRAGGEDSREEREAGRRKRSDFSRHFRELSSGLRDRLEEGCGRGRQGVIGSSDLLRTVFTEYRWEDFVIRLVARPDHSVSVHILRAADAPATFVDPDLAERDRREREDYFLSRVERSEWGDVTIREVPSLAQGNTPYCGVLALAMAGHYLGLRAHTETLAAGAEFANTGSARGSDMIDLYRAVGDEIEMNVRVSPKFDFDRVQRSLEDGLPVIVWRRVSREREDVHARVAKEFREEPGLMLDEPTEAERAAFPARDARGSPSHASVVTGFHERGEVIYREPWGEPGIDRRMRREEMEDTVYAVFTFRL